MNITIRTVALVVTSVAASVYLTLLVFNQTSRQSNDQIMAQLHELAEWSCSVEFIDEYHRCRSYIRAKASKQEAQIQSSWGATGVQESYESKNNNSSSWCISTRSLEQKLALRVSDSWREKRKIRSKLATSHELVSELSERKKAGLFTPTQDELPVLSALGWWGHRC